MERQTKNVFLAVIATGIMAFSGVLIETAMNVTFPVLMTEFQISTSLVQWVTTIYLLMIAVTVPISGFLLKNYSIKQLFLTANLLFLAGVLLDFYSPSFWVLLGGRILQGMATGIALPLMFHIILTEVPLKKRGMMMGMGTLATAIAPAIGPTYGGLITTHLSWHFIYLFLVPVLLISLVLGSFNILSFKVKKIGQMDWLSFTYLACTFSGFLLFFSFLKQPISLLFLVLGILGLWASLKRSKKQTAPLLNFSLLKDKKFTQLFLCFLIYHFLLLGLSFILPNYIQMVLGQDAAIAGLAMFPGAAIGAILAPISGNILDKTGPKKILLVGSFLSLLGVFLLLIFIWLSFGTGWLILGHFIFEIGIGFSYSNFMTTAMNQLPKVLYTDGNTLINTFQQFIGGFATAFVAAIIGLFQSFNPSFEAGTSEGALFSSLLCVLLMALGVVFITKLQKEKLN